MTFAGALRSMLRQDPDIIMVGEIRDKETAEVAVHASLTGHLVLSTIHANDAASTITRLFHMGVESYLVSSSVICVLAQRLVRRICPECRIDYVPAAGRASAARHPRRHETLPRPRLRVLPRNRLSGPHRRL